jgi:hypothetical protein
MPAGSGGTRTFRGRIELVALDELERAGDTFGIAAGGIVV